MSTTQGLALDDPAYFDRLDQAERTHWWSNAVWRIAGAWLDEATRSRRDLDALDVGCGAGYTLNRLAKRPEIRSVCGLDPSPFAFGRACSHPTLRGSALNLPFPTSRFDLATCFDVFQHLPPGSDRLAARELRRVVRPGGFVLVRANGRGLWPDPAISATLYRLSELVDVLQGAGFIVVKASYVNCLPAVATEVLGRLRASPKFGHPAGRGLRLDAPSPWKNRVMSLIAGMEARVAGRFGQALPTGHSTMVLARVPVQEAHT